MIHSARMKNIKPSIYLSITSLQVVIHVAVQISLSNLHCISFINSHNFNQTKQNSIHENISVRCFIKNVQHETTNEQIFIVLRLNVETIRWRHRWKVFASFCFWNGSLLFRQLDENRLFTFMKMGQFWAHVSFFHNFSYKRWNPSWLHLPATSWEVFWFKLFLFFEILVISIKKALTSNIKAFYHNVARAVFSVDYWGTLKWPSKHNRLEPQMSLVNHYKHQIHFFQPQIANSEVQQKQQKLQQQQQQQLLQQQQQLLQQKIFQASQQPQQQQLQQQFRQDPTSSRRAVSPVVDNVIADAGVDTDLDKIAVDNLSRDELERLMRFQQYQKHQQELRVKQEVEGFRFQMPRMAESESEPTTTTKSETSEGKKVKLRKILKKPSTSTTSTTTSTPLNVTDDDDAEAEQKSKLSENSWKTSAPDFCTWQVSAGKSSRVCPVGNFIRQ